MGYDMYTQWSFYGGKVFTDLAKENIFFTTKR